MTVETDEWEICKNIIVFLKRQSTFDGRIKSYGLLPAKQFTWDEVPSLVLHPFRDPLRQKSTTTGRHLGEFMLRAELTFHLFPPFNLESMEEVRLLVRDFRDLINTNPQLDEELDGLQEIEATNTDYDPVPLQDRTVYTVLITIEGERF